MKTTFGPIQGELLGLQSHYLAEAYPRGTLGRALVSGSVVAKEALEKLLQKLHDEFSNSLALALQEPA